MGLLARTSLATPSRSLGSQGTTTTTMQECLTSTAGRRTPARLPETLRTRPAVPTSKRVTRRSSRHTGPLARMCWCSTTNSTSQCGTFLRAAQRASVRCGQATVHLKMTTMGGTERSTPKLPRAKRPSRHASIRMCGFTLTNARLLSFAISASIAVYDYCK
eukprot:SAG31_NODE_1549_length_7913_cov_8.822882_4_plen_161_part_00